MNTTPSSKAILAKTRRLLLETELTIYQIADKVGRGKTYVSTQKQQLEKEIAEGHMEEVKSLSPSVVLRLAKKLEDSDPQMAKDLEGLSEAIDSLDKLQPKLHKAVATVIDTCTTNLAKEDIKPADFSMYAELILKAYATVNHKGPITQVNVQQNTVAIDQLKAERQRIIKQYQRFNSL